MNTIGSNECVRFSRSAVFEMNVHGTILLILYRINALVEVCAFRRNDFDKFIEKVRSMHALLACGIDLSVNKLALVLTFTLKNTISPVLLLFGL